MMERRPTERELQQYHRELEVKHRALAIQLVQLINDNPEATYGELVELSGEILETLAIVVVSRLNVESRPVTLKHPKGRKVDFYGKISDEFGEYQ